MQTNTSTAHIGPTLDNVGKTRGICWSVVNTAVTCATQVGATHLSVVYMVFLIKLS